jgi:hypothetical protein
MLDTQAPEIRLLEFIDNAAPWDKSPWTGSAAELERFLLKDEETRWQVARLLPNSSTCGTLLGRLAAKFPDRFNKTTSKGKSTWTIKSPQD